MPLTERILARLPGSRLAWVLLWAGVQMVSFSVQAVYQIFPPPWATYRPEMIVVFPLIFAYATLVSLWATKRMWSFADRLRPALAGMVPENRWVEESWPFRSTGSAIGPFVITSASVIAFEGPILLRAPTWGPGLSMVITPFLILPIGTLIWVYGSILWGLNQLGRTDLRLGPFEEDSSLGLGPFGSLAAVAFGLLMLVLAPLMIGGTFVGIEAVGLVFNLTTLATVVALLFLSVYRLHRRLVAEKLKHVAWARRQYGQAFRAAMENPQTMRERAGELQVAAEAERRALAIQSWPFDASAFRGIGAVVSGVLVAMIARLVLSRMGL